MHHNKTMFHGHLIAYNGYVVGEKTPGCKQPGYHNNQREFLLKKGFIVNFRREI